MRILRLTPDMEEMLDCMLVEARRNARHMILRARAALLLSGSLRATRIAKAEKALATLKEFKP